MNIERKTLVIVGGVFSLGFIISVLLGVHWYRVYTKNTVYLGGEIVQTSSSSIVIMGSHGNEREILIGPYTRIVQRKKIVPIETVTDKQLSVRAHYNQDGILEAEVIRVIGSLKP